MLSGSKNDIPHDMEGIFEEKVEYAPEIGQEATGNIKLLPREKIETQAVAVFQHYSSYMFLTNQRIIFLKRSMLGDDTALYIKLSVISEISLSGRIYMKYGNIKSSFAIVKTQAKFNDIDHEATAAMFDLLRKELPDAVAFENKLTPKGRLCYMAMAVLIAGFIVVKLLATFGICCIK